MVVDQSETATSRVVGVPKISFFGDGKYLRVNQSAGTWSWTRVDAADSVDLLLSYIVGTCRDIGHTRLVVVRRDSIVSEFGYRFGAWGLMM